MTDQPSLKILCNDLTSAAIQLKDAVERKDWDSAERISRIILGLASRMYARANAINTALSELADNK
jgi:hypothetical protein